MFDLSEVPLDTKPVRRKRSSFKHSVDEVRSFGGWTLSKLEVLRLYLRMYPRVAGGGSYLDLFAGTGLVGIDGHQHAGSALVALDSKAFKSLHLFELQPMCAKLTHNLQDHQHWSRCTLIPGDSNKTLASHLAGGSIDPAKPLFAFLDPDSTQLDWATVQSLATFKTFDEGARQCKTELWILFNLEQAIRRLWPKDKTAAPPHGHVLDRVMGGREAWIDLWIEGRSSDHLVYRYCERLDQLGYAFVYPQRILDPATGLPQYWMIHATDHRAAESFMRWAKVNATRTPSMSRLEGVDWPDPIGTKRTAGKRKRSVAKPTSASNASPLSP